MNIAVNIEEQVANLDACVERNYNQTIFKWDNATDINCFEPEYDATRLFVDYFRRRPEKYLLLYAGKSDNVDYLLPLDHGGKTIVQWSLAPETQARRIEVGTACSTSRIEAAAKCQEAGYLVRFRFSPIIPVKNWREEYAEMIRRIFAATRPDVIALCFFGWMDFDAMASCLDLDLLDPWAVDLARTRREEVRDRRYGPFVHEVRETVHRFLIDQIRSYSPTTAVSICLESQAMWDVFGKELGRKGDGFLCTCGPACTPGTAFYESRQAFFAARAPAPCASSRSERCPRPVFAPPVELANADSHG
jgi:spore photoproduct lyase